MHYADLAEIAREIVDRAGDIALRYFRQSITVEDKHGEQGFDPVTRADREVEQYIREQLAQAFPQDNIVGEEFGSSGTDGRRTWLIDPIDGTRAFITGVPAWGILLGLTDGERCLCGIARQPYLDESFVGVDGSAWLYRQGARTALHCSGTARLEDASLYTTTPAMFAGTALAEQFDRLGRTVKLQRFGGDCYSYCLLAMGQIDLVVECQLQPYDIVPLIPIIESAGGVITDLNGDSPLHGGAVIAAATGALHQQALAIMSP